MLMCRAVAGLYPTAVGGAGTVIDGTRLRAIAEAYAHSTVTRARSAA